MRAVDKSEDFAAALASCRREAINSFGDDAVLVEKYAQRPRHIEIQVFGDTQDNYVYLFERDCSVQRRHQKVLEEAPAPGMTEALRREMGEAAVAAARAVHYVGAGTVEFIVEQLDGRTTAGPPQGGTAPSGGSEAHAVASVRANGFPPGRPKENSAPSGGSAVREATSVGAKFYFMEMNTRLQVEHPVTEAITGLDLVEWQLRVAAGEPLPLKQAQLKIHGHAIEARICAENPDKQFLPATGTLQVYRQPACTRFERAEGGVRIDDGVREGDAISPYYDSMVAKLIVHGDTREDALSRMDKALGEFHIVGLQTNVQFLRHVVASESFAKADLDTALIPREAAVLFEQEKIGAPLAMAGAIAFTLLQEKALETADPFSRRDGWRSHGPVSRSFEFEFHGQPHKAQLTYQHEGSLQLALNGQLMSLNIEPAADGLLVTLNGQRAHLQVYRLGEQLHLFSADGATQITVIDLLAHAGVAQQEAGRLTAPMPGKVLSFAVQAGDKVSRGQALAIMEAMKMEHTIAAPADGVVAEILYAPGDQVPEGAELLRLQAEPPGGRGKS
jgi:3-methylcrotonyl-CoA carboxylase alpha subunit